MAKIAYDDYYLEDDYFGAPYKGLVDFFRENTPKGRLLDLGCGQGRDSLALAQLGYEVIAVDHSDVGIQKLQTSAINKGLKIQVHVADIYQYCIEPEVDIVLLDSMLHFYKKDLQKEQALVGRILTELKPGGLFANFLLKGKSREKTLKKVISDSGFALEVVVDQYVDYPEASAQYHMLVVRKK